MEKFFFILFIFIAVAFTNCKKEEYKYIIEYHIYNRTDQTVLITASGSRTSGKIHGRNYKINLKQNYTLPPFSQTDTIEFFIDSTYYLKYELTNGQIFADTLNPPITVNRKYVEQDKTNNYFIR